MRIGKGAVLFVCLAEFISSLGSLSVRAGSELTVAISLIDDASAVTGYRLYFLKRKVLS